MRLLLLILIGLAISIITLSYKHDCGTRYAATQYNINLGEADRQNSQHNTYYKGELIYE